MKFASLILILFVKLSLVNISLLADDNDYWEPGFGAPVLKNPDPASLAVDGDVIYVVENNRIIRYDPNNNIWRSIGLVSSNSIRKIYVHNGLLYAVGNFERMEGTPASRIAVWNNFDWSVVGDTLFGKINDILFSESGILYIAGVFHKPGDAESFYVAALIDGVWTPLDGQPDGEARAIATHKDKIYFGGSFEHIGEMLVNNVACFDESDREWKNLDAGVGGAVYALAVDESGKLFAGGAFITAGRAGANYVAEWSGSAWGAVGEGFSYYVYALAYNNGELFAGGFFNSTSAGKTANLIAKYNGTDWVTLNGELSGGDYPAVFQLLFDNQGKLLTGGTFTSANGIKTNGYARYNGSAWEDVFNDMRNGTNSVIHALLPSSDGLLYAGGGWTFAGDENSPGLAAWNGAEWESCGRGLQPHGSVYSLYQQGNRICFTGWFQSVDGTYLNNVAYWDTGARKLFSIGEGIDAGDYAMGPLAADEYNIYVSGVFTEVEGVQSRKIICWNGNNWQTMQGGLSGGQERVGAMRMGPDGKLYVGGSFTKAGDINVQYIAVWNPRLERWEGLNGGTNGTVNAIAFEGRDMYVGGNFSTAGGILSGPIAKYNIDSGEWSRLDSTIFGQVLCILPRGDEIYIGGRFAQAGDTAASGITKYSLLTGKYLPLGSGLTWGTRSGTCYTMTVYNNKLYVGGSFTNAGGKQSTNFACWNALPASVETSEIANSAKPEIRLFPNPAREKINICLKLHNSERLEICLVNILGVEVARIPGRIYPAGESIIEWRGDLPSGGYVVKVIGKGFTDYHKVLIIK